MLSKSSGLVQKMDTEVSLVSSTLASTTLGMFLSVGFCASAIEN